MKILHKMTGGRFFKSKEMVEAYKDAGLEYKDELWDEDFTRFEAITRKTAAKDCKIEIGNIIRLVLPNGEQYIYYDQYDIRQDPLGNKKRFFRSAIGLYDIPTCKKEIVQEYNEELSQYENVVKAIGVDSIATGYSIPFTNKAVEELSKYFTESTRFIIMKGYYKQGIKVSIKDFNSWKANEPDAIDALLRFGKYPISVYEKTIMDDEKAGKIQFLSPAGNVRSYG